MIFNVYFITDMVISIIQVVDIKTQVCRAAQEKRNLGRGTDKTLFSRICSSKLPEQKHTKFLCKFPRGGAPPIPNLSWIHQAIREICAFKVCLIFFVFFFSFFSQHFLNQYNSCVLCWIALKFGPLLEHIRAYI